MNRNKLTFPYFRPAARALKATFRFASLASALIVTAHASSLLVSFDIANATTSSLPLSPIYSGDESVISVSSLTATGLHPAWACCQSGAGELSYSGWAPGGPGGPGPANAPTPNGPYLQFSVTATAGTVALSTLDYSWFATANSSLFNGADELTIYASYDGFVTNTVVANEGIPNVPPGSPVQAYSENMSAYSIATGQTLTLRFVGWSNVASWDAGAGFWNNGNPNVNLSLSGTAPTPEPATAWLLAAALASAGVLRKRVRTHRCSK